MFPWISIYHFNFNFNKQSNSFASASRSLSICSPFMYNYTVKWSNLIKFSWEREQQGDRFCCVFGRGLQLHFPTFKRLDNLDEQ